MTDTNERIARGLGWQTLYEQEKAAGRETFQTDHGMWLDCTGHEVILPDYEHSLDALLEPLGVLRERGWELSIDTSLHNVTVWHFDMKRRFRHGFKTLEQMVEKAALAVAEALEASK